MGKSQSAKQQVTDYYMSLHFGVCATVDSVRRLRVNEKVAWDGVVTTLTNVSINQGDLFGGKKKEGGVVGTMTVLPGGSTQVMPEGLAAKLGRTSATCPGFRGLTSVFFHGGGTGRGFLWSSNNYVIAQTIDITVQRAPKGLDPTKAIIGSYGDANPAHIIFETLINTDWGMGAPTTIVDSTSFSNAAITLYNEGFGLSMLWTRQSSIEDFISEILDHIQATLFVNPRTGLLTLNLYRDDYDPDTLRVINPDNADLNNFQRKMWGETVNEIVVSWTNPDNEQDETVTAQDLGAIAAQGDLISDSRNYYGVRNKELAVRLAERDLRTSSAPLATVEVELDRTAWDLLPGEVVKVDWPEYDLEDLVMRVGTVDYGKLGDPVIKATLIEDIFSLEHPTSDAPGSGWTRPGEEPLPMAHTQVFTLPQFFVTSAILQAGVLDLFYPEVVAGVFGHPQGHDTSGFELLSEQVSTTGVVSFKTAGTKNITDRVVLLSSMSAAVSSTLPGETVSDVLLGPQVGGFVFIGSGDDDDMEIALVDSYDGFDWTLARGVLDTTPRTWAAGTPLWFVNPGVRITDDKTVRSAGESPEYKLLSRTSLGILAEADAPVVTGTMSARPHLPLRPANVKVNGTGFGSLSIGASANVTITWATRNRTLEDGQVVKWNAGTVSPEYAQETVVSIYDQDAHLVYEQGGLWTETSLVLPKTNFDRYSAITVKVWSRRTDGATVLSSLQSHTITVTGFANNPAAPIPPTPPAVTPPPSPIGAPASGAFVATGTAISNSSGASTPAVLVTGTSDNASATGLVIRYRKTGVVVDWVYHPTVDLTAGGAVKVVLAPMAAVTDYLVEVAYAVQNNPLSGWQALNGGAAVTTGALVSSDTVNVGTRTAVQLLADVDQALADSAAALAAAGGDAADLSAAIAAATAARDAAQDAQAAAEAARDDAQDAYTAADAAADLATDKANLAASKATDAASSATAAAGSASTATTAATAAGSSATSASGYANTASTAATNAANSATAAATSASSAASSSTAAGNSASAANTAKVAAETAATNAANSASAAATSASSAAASNTAAGTNASAAQTAATNAATSASQASTSASQASTSATNASGSASTAATQATNAANSATAAGGSASAAAGSASVASTKATEAGNSATSASTSANTASTQAGSATASATSASASAAAATSSAAAAATSASLAALYTTQQANLLYNPTFGLGFQGYTYTAGQFDTATDVREGTVAYLVGNLSSGSRSFAMTPAVQVQAGGVYSFQARMVSYNATAGLVRAYVTWYGADFSVKGFSVANLAPGSDWTVVKVENQPVPSGAVYAQIVCDVLNLTVTSGYVAWQRLKFEAGTHCTPYSDEATLGTATQANAAAIASEAAVRASETAALASTTTALTSTVNGHTASLTTQAATLADVTGKFYSRYMMEVSANGVITGVYAVSTQGSPGTSISAIKLRADTFAVVRSDDTGTAYPFIYDATTGTFTLKDIVVQSANIGALAVKTLNLDGLAVTTDKLQNHAVTNSVNSVTNASLNFNVGTETTLMSLNIAVAEAASRVEVYLFIIQSAGSASRFNLTIYRDGTPITTIPNYGASTPVFGMPVVDFPGNGNHTYEVRTLRTSSGGGSNDTSYRYLTVTEYKR